MADGADLFLSLPEDALALIASYLNHPRHLMALCLTSRRLYHPLLSSSSTWVSLASSSASIPLSHLHSWHSLSSIPYPSICRFLFTACRLSLSPYVHQNPELGNLVFSVWGFLSLVFVRIVPQNVSKNLAFSPVMEIHCDADGAPSVFFLHGEDGSIHAGYVSSTIPSDPTILLLEADFSTSSETKTGHYPSLFQKLEFEDRERLLEFLSSKSAMKLPSDLQSAPMFPRSHDDFNILSRRREVLISMHKSIRGGLIDCATVESSLCSSSPSGNKSFDGDVEDGMKELNLIGNSVNSTSTSSSDRENENFPLIEYLRTGNGDSIGLSLKATDTSLSYYWSWPRMHESFYGLYKLPLNEPQPEVQTHVGTFRRLRQKIGRYLPTYLKKNKPQPFMEYSGLWAGSFGWPPTLLGEDKPDKSLHLLLLSYHQSEEGLVLIGTIVLQGSNYASYPIGSSMFTANSKDPSTDAFPWEMEVKVNCSFTGEGISDGYGFRYPGSEPGSLYSLNNGFLAFMWRESKAVLVLERIDLSEMVAKGEQVATILPAISNFTYLKRSYINVYTRSPNI